MIISFWILLWLQRLAFRAWWAYRSWRILQDICLSCRIWYRHWWRPFRSRLPRWLRPSRARWSRFSNGFLLLWAFPLAGGSSCCFWSSSSNLCTCGSDFFRIFFFNDFRIIHIINRYWISINSLFLILCKYISSLICVSLLLLIPYNFRYYLLSLLYFYTTLLYYYYTYFLSYFIYLNAHYKNNTFFIYLFNSLAQLN